MPALGRARRVDGGIDDAAARMQRGGISATPAPSSAASLSPAANSPSLAAIGMQANIYSRPDGTSKRVGLSPARRSVARDPQPAGTAGCRRLVPHLPARICLHRHKTPRPTPRTRWRERPPFRPDITKAMPYRYAFVRAVAPLYLRIPTAQEQTSTEFKLAEHLDWWKDGGAGQQGHSGSQRRPPMPRSTARARRDAGPLSALSTDLSPRAARRTNRE